MNGNRFTESTLLTTSIILFRGGGLLLLRGTAVSYALPGSPMLMVVGVLGGAFALVRLRQARRDPRG